MDDVELAQKRVWTALENRDFVSAAAEINAVVSFFETSQATEYVDYIEYLFLLHQVYTELKDQGAAIGTLGKLLNHFINVSNPAMLNQRGVEIYIKTWTYLGYMLAEAGCKDDAIVVFQKCLPLLMIMRGPECAEVDTVKWYIESIEKDGRITTHEPLDNFMPEEELEGLRCSFCHTGQIEIVTGPAVYICRKCISMLGQFIQDTAYCAHLRIACPDAYCSFQCGNTLKKDDAIFPGPGVFICGPCVLRYDTPEYWEAN